MGDINPSAFFRISARTISALLGGIGVFELWAAWLGVPGFLGYGCSMLAGASGIVWWLDR